MPYAAGTIKVVFEGSLPHGQRFAFGFALNGGSGSSDSQVASVVSSARDNLSAEASVPLLHTMTTGTHFDTVRAYHYDGGAVADAIGVLALDQNGLSNSGELPAQVALCVSLITASTARSGRGRIFLPSNGVALTGGQMSSPTVTDLANSMIALMKGSFQDGGTGGNFVPVVASLKHSVSRAVIAARVDSRLDVIRHRAAGEVATAVHVANYAS